VYIHGRPNKGHDDHFSLIARLILILKGYHKVSLQKELHGKITFMTNYWIFYFFRDKPTAFQFCFVMSQKLTNFLSWGANRVGIATAG